MSNILQHLLIGNYLVKILSQEYNYSLFMLIYSAFTNVNRLTKYH